jgi:hypothetical protein
VILAAALLIEGCIGLPFASLGGRARVTAAAAVTSRPDADARLVVQTHLGAAVMSVVDPGERDFDVEVGYALDAYPGDRPSDRHGGYAGLVWFPWQEEGARVSVGADVDALWGFDQRLAVGATLSAGIEAYAACEGAMGGGDLLYAGLVGWGRGEWGLGVHAQASYRFVEGQHDATFGATLSLRFPAGIGVGYVTALAIADVAAQSRSGSSSSSVGTAEEATSAASATPFGFCERPIPYVSPDAPARTPELDLWRCEARAGSDVESGVVHAPDAAAAERACHAEFVVARADGSRCVCLSAR